MFDAYTVKKIVPRLVAAIILIQLSWFIFTSMLKITNDIAFGIEGLMYAPFGGKSALSLSALINGLAGSNGAGTGLFTSMVILGSVGGGLALGTAAVLSLGLSALLGALIALFVLVLRRAILLALLIIAPIALVAWILPGTEKYWKMWWESFSKLLLLFPMVLLLIAAGRVLAFVTLGAGAGGGVSEATVSGISEWILVIVCFFGPYFLIPKTFQMAGAAFSSLSGMANDRSRGVFDRLRNFRSNQMKKNWEETKAGNRFKGGAPDNLRGRFNKAAQTATLLPHAGLSLNPETRRARLETSRSARNIDYASEFLEKNAAARAIKGDDDKLWAVMNASNEAEVRKELALRAPERFHNPVDMNNAVAEVMAFKRAAGEDVALKAATIAQSGTGTGFNYRGDGVDDDMMTAVIRASGSDRGASGRMLAVMRENLKQSGRIDLGGGGFAKNAMIMDKLRTAMGNGGMIEVEGADGTKHMEHYGTTEALEELHEDVLASNAGAVIAGKLQAIKNIAPTVTRLTDKALKSGDEDAAARALADIAGKYEAAGMVAPQNAGEWADDVMTHTIRVGDLPAGIQQMLSEAIQVKDPQSGAPSMKTEISYQDAIRVLRSNPKFTVMRREFSDAATASAAQYMQESQRTGTPPQPGNFTPPSF